MAETITYTGNAGLGFGSNPDVPVANTDLSVLNDTMRTIMLQNNDWNVRQYQQKIKDRDNLNQLILNNEVSAGGIDKEYQPYYDEALKRSQKLFEEWGGDFNNTAGYRKYQEGIQQLKDVAAQAQMKTLARSGREKERAQIGSPTKKEDFDRWSAAEDKKSFWSTPGIYQPLYDWDGDKIFALAKPITTTKAGTVDNPISETTTLYTYDNTLKNSQDQWLNDIPTRDAAEGINKELMNLPPERRANYFSGINNQLQKYNNDVGQQLYGRPLQQGDKEFATPVDARFDPQSGQLLVGEPMQTFAAKIALAHQPTFVTKGQSVDKDFAKLGNDKAELELKKQKLALDARKLGIDAAKAGAYIRNMDANARKINDSIAAQVTTIEPQYQKFIQAIVPAGNIVSRKVFTNGKLVDTQRASLDIIPVNSLSAGDQLINGPVVDAKGKIIVGKLEPYPETGKKQGTYYIPRYVDPINGTRINLAKLPADMEEGYRITNAKKKITKEDYLKALLSNGALDLVVEGKNGSVNYSDMLKSAKLINAAATTKGEENINPTEPASTYGNNNE